MSSIEGLLRDLAQATIGTTFNQFRDRGPEDLPNAPAIRLANLRRYLEERADADVMGIGEAAGYQGMRWSGIAFTGEVDLLRWGGAYRRSFAGEPAWSEPSGTVVHRLLEKLGAERRVILWNTVPTHPHQLGKELSNRLPRAPEIATGQTFALRLLELMKPRTVVAIGRIPARMLQRNGIAHHYVRHPSHGGTRLFAEGMTGVLAEK